MTDRQRALLLMAIRELQLKIDNYPANRLIPDLQNYYGVEIASHQDLFDELNELAEKIDIEGLDNG